MQAADPRHAVQAVLLASLIVLGAGIALCVLRIARGPTQFDRVLAFDCLVLDIVGVALAASMRLNTDAFIDMTLVTTLFGFISTITLAAYLGGSLGP